VIYLARTARDSRTKRVVGSGKAGDTSVREGSAMASGDALPEVGQAGAQGRARKRNIGIAIAGGIE
jgi:hypothetical protein